MQGNGHEPSKRKKKKAAPKPRTLIAIFIAEELERLNMSQNELEQRSGIPDSTIGRIRAGQEPKPSQLARLAKAFGRRFWYVVQRAGYEIDEPDLPASEMNRLAAVFLGDSELSTFLNTVLRLSPANRRAVLKIMQSLNESDDDLPTAPEVQ